MQISDIEVTFKKAVAVRYDGRVHVTEVGREFAVMDPRSASERQMTRMYFDFKLVWLNVDQFEPELFERYLVNDFRNDYDPRKTPPNVVRVYVDLVYSRIALATPISVGEGNVKFFQKVAHVLQQMRTVNKPLKQYRLRLGNLLQVQTSEQV